MAIDPSKTRYRSFYTALLRLYPRPFRRRFAEGMEQTFNDLCRERQAEGRGLSAFVLGLCAETFAGILRERIEQMLPPRKNIIRLVAITSVVLSVPLIAMQFSDQVDWSPFDFAAMGALIFGGGLAFELIAGRARDSAYRAATGLALATGFLLIWINLAIGIIGSEDDPANVLCLAVLFAGAAGAAIARLRPAGMARTMFATAIVQVLVPAVATMIFRPVIESDQAVADLIRVFFLNASFALMFVGSAALYRHASTIDRGVVTVEGTS